MKTLNIRENIPIMNEPDVKQPCWYVNFEAKDDREEAMWVVGRKSMEGTGDSEYKFKISKAGDVEDAKFWARITSLEFALELLDRYRKNPNSISAWVKDGCPI